MSRKNTLTMAAAAIVLVGGFYYFFFVANSTNDTVLSANAPASEAEIGFIALVSKLDPIEFDTHILDDQRFKSLVDIRTQVLPEPKGRTDLFGALGH